MPTVNEIDLKIEGHIDICAVRYEGIEREMRGVNARIKRLETILIASAASIIGLLLHLTQRGI